MPEISRRKRFLRPCLTDNAFTNGVDVNDAITSHQWVVASACGAFPT
ncbi:hypothetical protein ABZ725_01880 [Streptomyces sp. NPDC006872]